MTDLHGPHGRSSRLDRALAALLRAAPELEAAAVVSFDGLPMASALPAGMDEDRVAAMSAALLSLGDRAAQGLGRGDLSQVYVEGEHGTVFLVSADEEAVLVAVASGQAKVGLMLFEVRRAAQDVAAALLADDRDAELAESAAEAEATAAAMAAYVPPPAPGADVPEALDLGDFAPEPPPAPAATVPQPVGFDGFAPDPPVEHHETYPDETYVDPGVYADPAVYADHVHAETPAHAEHEGGPVMVPAGQNGVGYLPGQVPAEPATWPQTEQVWGQG